jgi:hypothetical protein
MVNEISKIDFFFWRKVNTYPISKAHKKVPLTTIDEATELLDLSLLCLFQAKLVERKRLSFTGFEFS